MDYKSLVARTAEKSATSKAKTGVVLAALRQVIIEALKEDEAVKFASLGTFKVVKRKATNRRDPKTREIRSVPAKIKPKFSFSKIAEDEVIA